jgi:hypothetical protein
MSTPSPLFDTPPLVDPGSGFQAWFFDDRRTAVTQATGPVMSKAAADFLIGPFDDELKKRFVSKGLKVRLVHDWRSLESYDPETRSRLIAWGNGNAPHTEFGGIALSNKASIFARIAVTTAIGALRIFGANIESLDDRIDQVLAELRSSRSAS